MPKIYRRRSHRSTIRGRNFRIRFRFVHFGAMVVIAGILITWWLKTSTDAAFEDAKYNVVGAPTIIAAFINRVLDDYHSPAAGKGQALYDDGVKYGIDPVYA